MSFGEKSKEIIVVAVENYLKSYTALHGKAPTEDVIKGVIRDLEELALEKERQDLIQRFSNWTPKNIKDGIELFKASINPMGMKLSHETEDAQFYVEQKKRPKKASSINENGSQKQDKA